MQRRQGRQGRRRARRGAGLFLHPGASFDSDVWRHVTGKTRTTTSSSPMIMKGIEIRHVFALVNQSGGDDLGFYANKTGKLPRTMPMA